MQFMCVGTLFGAPDASPPHHQCGLVFSHLCSSPLPLLPGAVVSPSLQSTPYNAPMSTAYTTQAQTLVRKQVALAGYRLAQLLDLALGNGTVALDGPTPSLRGSLSAHRYF
jgi:hypothetical protein